MDQEMGFLDKVYAAYERAFVLHDDSWLTPSAMAGALVLIVLGVAASHWADRWHEARLARSTPPLTQDQVAHARRWWGAGTWAFYILIVVAYVLAYNWS